MSWQRALRRYIACLAAANLVSEVAHLPLCTIRLSAPVSELAFVEVREAWTSRTLMPVLPLTGTGLSPLLQWIVLPPVAFRWALQPIRGRSVKPGKHA